MKYLIVGIDPGTTTAVAALDLRGEMVKVLSGRGWGVGKTVEIISGIGRPVIVATDKSKVPAFVEKVAARFKAKLAVPNKDMGSAEKGEIAGGFRGHERDAMAAAVRAFKGYESMFRKVERSVPNKKWDSVKRKLVLDEAINRADALKDAAVKKGSVRVPKKRKGELEKELSMLISENRRLKKEIDDLKTTRTRVVRHITDESMKRLADARLDNIRTLRKKIGELEDEVEHLKKIRLIWESGGVPLEHSGDIEGAEPMEMGGVKYISREEFSKVERKKAQSLLKKVIKSHRSKRP